MNHCALGNDDLNISFIVWCNSEIPLCFLSSSVLTVQVSAPYSNTLSLVVQKFDSLSDFIIFVLHTWSSLSQTCQARAMCGYTSLLVRQTQQQKLIFVTSVSKKLKFYCTKSNSSSTTLNTLTTPSIVGLQPTMNGRPLNPAIR